MLAPAVPLLINGFATAPVTTALELVGGTATGIGATLATDKAIEKGSDGKYTGFTDYITKKFPDSNPYIVEQFHPAAWIGGLLGGAGIRNAFMRTPRGKVELINSELSKNISNTKLFNSYLDDAVLSGKVGWGPNQIIHYRHGSYNPNLSKFEVHNTWDVTNRNASPFKWFGTEVSSPKNMMDDRPYQYIGLTEIKKPMIQLGEYNIKGKNDTRNYLVAESRQRGADAYYLQGIADNKAEDQNVLIKFLDYNGEPGGFGIKPSKLTEAERLGIPKGGKVPYTPEENTAFRNQINEFAEKYGYNTIGDEVTDPEVLEKYARALIKQHNTFYRGISYAPDDITAMKWASQPHHNAEMYITPYSNVASGYGDPVEVLRPYKLGSDRT
jgi:hypothetical protein